MWLLVLQRGGRIGALGLAVSALGEMGIGLFHKPLDWEQVFHGVAHIGLAVAILGITFHAKAATDMIVASEAEKRLADPGLPDTSVVPAIQREMNKQERASGGVPKP